MNKYDEIVILSDLEGTLLDEESEEIWFWVILGTDLKSTLKLKKVFEKHKQIVYVLTFANPCFIIISNLKL